MGFFKRLAEFFTGGQASTESDSSDSSPHGPFTLWTQADSIKVNLISQTSRSKGPKPKGKSFTIWTQADSVKVNPISQTSQTDA
jgi:hypothetical protein